MELRARDARVFRSCAMNGGFLRDELRAMGEIRFRARFRERVSFICVLEFCLTGGYCVFGWVLDELLINIRYYIHF